MQPKLLRVLEDGSLRRVGSHKERRVDVRIIAATNRDLTEDVKNGAFREDLYYRLNVMSLKLSPLRDRGNDINLLIDSLLGKDWEIEDDARAILQNYHWPGNVRQLANVFDRATVLADDHTITVDDLPSEIVDGVPESGMEVRRLTATKTDSSRLDEIEKTHIVEILQRENGNKARAARALGIHRRKLYRLLERYDLHKPDTADS